MPGHSVRRGVSDVRSTGLGLDIVRRVAASAGGEVRIGSSRGGARIATQANRSRRFRRGCPAGADA